MGPIYQIKACQIPCKTQKKLFGFDKYMSVGKTLNMDSCSKLWGILEGIWGNPGEIPHIGWKIHGVYRVKKVLNCIRAESERFKKCVT